MEKSLKEIERSLANIVDRLDRIALAAERSTLLFERLNPPQPEPDPLVPEQLTDAELELFSALAPHVEPVQLVAGEGVRCFWLNLTTDTPSLEFAPEFMELVDPRDWQKIIDIYSKWTGRPDCWITACSDGGRILSAKKGLDGYGATQT